MNSYNGWPNYETWAVALWLDNDEYTYNSVREWADDADGPSGLAETLKGFIEEANPLAGSASVFTDLMGSALDSVNWLEIARTILDEAV